ncbi:MAG: hypothetical protein H0W68_13315 [Gemmatimonadaceae bacterium]|nr:hypothetical protein [Gemmatimonadaceae bacterium]
MADGTSAGSAERRETQRFGTIIVVGGGCYGSFFVRQLGRAWRAGAIAWDTLLVVDRDPACAVVQLPESERPRELRIAITAWRTFFDEYLSNAARDPDGHANDAIVPSPLMPHLMADWLVDRAAARWPSRRVDVTPLESAPAVPWQRAGEDGTHYVSFADWMCPINCVEPVRCPHTREARSWSMPAALREYAAAEGSAGREVAGTFVFHCVHRAYGVGMIDTRDVLAADATIADRGREGAVFLLGTASHCHGAVRRVVIGAEGKRPESRVGML